LCNKKECQRKKWNGKNLVRGGQFDLLLATSRTDVGAAVGALEVGHSVWVAHSRGVEGVKDLALLVEEGSLPENVDFLPEAKEAKHNDANAHDGELRQREEGTIWNIRLCDGRAVGLSISAGNAKEPEKKK